MVDYNAPKAAPDRKVSPTALRRFLFGTRRFGAVRAVVTIAILMILAGLASFLLMDIFYAVTGGEVI